MSTDLLGEGDQVELIRDVPGRRELRAGLRGTVVVAADSVWGLVSVRLPGRSGQAGKLWQLRRQHLRRVDTPVQDTQGPGAAAPAVAPAPGAFDSAPPGRATGSPS